MTTDTRFRQVHDYARHSGFLTGFPNFHQADYGQGVVYGTKLVPENSGEYRDVPRTQLGSNLARQNVGDMVRAANSYAQANGYAGALPTFHEADHGNGVVYGLVLYDSPSAEFRDVPATELGNPDLKDVGATFRSANDYAGRQGYSAGFPTFHQANYGDGRGVVRGVVLLRQGATDALDVPQTVLERYAPETAPQRSGGSGGFYVPRWFKQIRHYARRNGFAGGFPTFRERPRYQAFVEYEFQLLPGSVARHIILMEVSLGSLPDNAVSNAGGQLSRAVSDYAAQNGLTGAFPSFTEGDFYSRRDYGVTLISQRAFQRDVPAYILGNVDVDNVREMYYEANQYATRHGFAAAVPTFHQANYGGTVVRGLVLFDPGATEARWLTIPELRA
ncbi:hypothetical protein [Halosimplex salinum]|uniref:hypothetical protein n=1 Tax=Halosimplex salinum TaxID=1710538 RepID=UPI000F4AEA16|nr:hypothetical protein [Halosimplex salinum]